MMAGPVARRTWYLYPGGRVHAAGERDRPDARPIYECDEGDDEWREWQS